MSAPSQARHLAWRSMVRTLRHPHMIMPTLVFPLFMLAVNASGLQQATQIPGFPTDSYLTFTLGFAFLQGAIFAMLTAGTNLAEDIGTGFFTRLSLTPMRGSALLAGQLASVLLLSTIQAVTYLTVGLLAGADFASAPAASRCCSRSRSRSRARSARSACSWGSAPPRVRPCRRCSR